MDKALLMAKHRALFGDNKFRSIGKEYYEWKIYKNPVGEGEICLEIRDGKVVGSSTTTPKKIAILGEEFVAAELGDSFTLPEYRRQGINFKALKYCIEYSISRGINLIYGGPANQANYRLLLKAGLFPCSYIKYTFLVKSLKPILFAMKTIAKRLLLRDSSTNMSYLRYLVKAKQTQPKFVYPYDNYDENDFQVVIIDKFNEKIDGLWGKPRYLFYVFRDCSYLNWRFFTNPDKYIILAAVKDEKYLGYIVVKISKDNGTGVICDFITIEDSSDVFSVLVNKSEEILKQIGVNLVQIECIVGSPYYKTLNESGYYDYGLVSYQPLTIYSKTELGKHVLENSGKWHFTLGDSDEV